MMKTIWYFALSGLSFEWVLFTMGIATSLLYYALSGEKDHQQPLELSPEMTKHSIFHQIQFDLLNPNLIKNYPSPEGAQSNREGQ